MPWTTSSPPMAGWWCAGPAVGTDTVGFMGQPPTGQQATVTGITIYRLAAGKLVEHWDEWDMAGLVQQLGAHTPAPVGAP
jgi:hypothetical protein